MKIWVVIASTEYEASDVLCAFMAKADADAFVERCYVHSRKMPPYIDDIEGEADELWNARYDKYRRRHERWLKTHPAGALGASADHYTAQQLPLDRGVTAK